jgi:hypothetical protein
MQWPIEFKAPRRIFAGIYKPLDAATIFILFNSTAPVFFEADDLAQKSGARATLRWLDRFSVVSGALYAGTGTLLILSGSYVNMTSKIFIWTIVSTVSKAERCVIFLP